MDDFQNESILIDYFNSPTSSPANPIVKFIFALLLFVFAITYKPVHPHE